LIIPYVILKAEVGLKVNKYYTNQKEGGPTPLDESWWAALLAEEEELGGSFSARPYTSSQSEGKGHGQVTQTKPAQINWQLAQRVYENDETVCLQVVSYNRGGLLVEGGGLQGFVPLSHLVDLAAEKPEEVHETQQLAAILGGYVARTLSLKIIECEPDRGRVVFSERAALAEPGRRNQLLDVLNHGDIVEGYITNITDFGVFVDLGGVEGLIHVSELSWGRVRHPSDAAFMGQEIKAFVIQVDKDRCRVALSLKRLYSNPWNSAEERYHPGQITEAIITSLAPFGAFARLEEGLDGLIHISEMSPGIDKINPREILHEGQQVKVRVLHVDASHQRLGLSLRI
jgi:small subunit ribosomal protein S1